MKLLIVTQAVDEKDPILGFFVRWIAEFAKHNERIEVVCLKEGTHNLPTNVRVHSLGKEKGTSQVKYVLNFYRHIWRLRHEYDTVFIHMNPEYIVLGGLLWRLWGKRIAFWYNHPHAGLRFSIAVHIANNILHTSPYAASARFARAKQMPAGIDTEIFTPQPVARIRSALYMQGRIMPSKRVDVACVALRLLRKYVSAATLTLVGPEDLVYGNELRKNFSDLISSGTLIFKGPVPNEKTPILYSAHGASINLAAPGHFDKSVLEAMACGTPVIACSDVVKEEWRVKENDPQALAAALERMIALPELEYSKLQNELRAGVVAKHSLSALADSLARELSGDVAS